MSSTEHKLDETCHSVTDWYDGPRGGIADFRGKPHLFQSNFIDSEPDDDEEFFLLSPLDLDTFRLALEDWDIWRRWETAFHSKVCWAVVEENGDATLQGISC